MGVGGLAGLAALGHLGRFRVGRSTWGTPVVKVVPAMGTRVSFVVHHPDRRLANHAIARAIREIYAVHGSMTLHGSSPLTHLNRYGTKGPIEVPESLLAVLRRSQELNVATEGLFDASMGVALGGVEAAQLQRNWPKESRMDERMEVDWVNRRVRLGEPSVQLDFNAIAKGYAVDRAVSALREQGMVHFLVNAGGDLYAGGEAGPGEAGWRIHLEESEPDEPSLHSWLVSDRAVATSGNAHRPFNERGERALHLLDPSTGDPARGLRSATVLASTTVDADAWSTALFVGGHARTSKAIGRQSGINGFTIDESGQAQSVSG